MLKKIMLPAMLALGVSQLAQAKMIELNNHNADQCKQQLLAAKSTKPIIFMNIKGSKLSESLQPLYHQIAKTYPAQSFYMFTVDANNHDAIVAKTAEDCLDAKSIDTPYVYAYILSPSTQKLKASFVAADNMKLSENSTKQDILKFLSF